MKFEKLTDNKIRIIVEKTYFTNKNIDFSNNFFNSPTNDRLFLELLDAAEKKVGFKTNNHKLLIEAFCEDSDFVIFLITKYLEKKQKKFVNVKSIKGNICHKLNKSIYIYKIDNLDLFCSFCNFINTSSYSKSIFKKSILYYYNRNYYLVLNTIKADNNVYYKYLFSQLTEFFELINNNNCFYLKLNEYGKIILRNNAISNGIKYLI